MITADHEAARAADGVILPGVGAFPRAMQRVRELGLDQLVAERRDAGVADPRHLPRPATALRLLDRARGRERPRPARWASGQLRADGLKVPHIGWSPVRWERPSRLTEGIDVRDAVLLRPLLRPAGRRPTRCSARAAYGERFACAAERENVFGVQFHPEKSSAAGLRLLANFAGICAAAARRGVILYPAIDIRGGRAVRLLQGDYERETVYDADPADAAARWVGKGRSTCTSSTSTARERDGRKTSKPCAGSPPR